MNLRSKHSGFTIVELLIVIVVIGILAAIVLNTFANSQREARNTQRITAAKDWLKIIKLYAADKGQYPALFSNDHICLGDNLPTNMDANVNEDCFQNDNVKHPNAGVSASLRQYAPAFPAFPLASLSISSTLYVVGISVRSLNSVDGIAQTPMLLYVLEGPSQDCVLRPVVSGTSLASDGVTTGALSFSSNANNNTLCKIALPQPSTL